VNHGEEESEKESDKETRQEEKSRKEEEETGKEEKSCKEEEEEIGNVRLLKTQRTLMCIMKTRRSVKTVNRLFP
jgi:hypothetical protein